MKISVLKYLQRFCLPFALVALIGVMSCSIQDGLDIPFVVLPPNKTLPKNDNTSVRVALYVDTSDAAAVNLLKEIGNYYVEISGKKIPYFDYVIISGGELKQGEYTPYLDISSGLWRILDARTTLLRPLQDKGIKVLVGVTGGGGGVSFGTLADVTSQISFANHISSMRLFYGLDGVEFYDKNAASENRKPYPEIGQIHWNGQDSVLIDNENELTEAWKKGGEYMVDMMSYVIVFMGASTSFQGDLSLEWVERTPILVREEGFGKWLDQEIPRFAFATTLACLRYGINGDPSTFGKDNEGNPQQRFYENRFYGPLNINLSDIDEPRLKLFSEKFGTRDWGTENAVSGDSRYGLVFYSDMRPHSAEQNRLLSITSEEIFWSEVQYLP